jgi:hypothetical protein
MTSAPRCATRSPAISHTGKRAFLFIDYPPAQLATIRSVDPALLLENAVSTLRTMKTFGVPVVHSAVSVRGLGLVRCAVARQFTVRTSRSVHHERKEP